MYFNHKNCFLKHISNCVCPFINLGGNCENWDFSFFLQKNACLIRYEGLYKCKIVCFMLMGLCDSNFQVVFLRRITSFNYISVYICIDKIPACWVLSFLFFFLSISFKSFQTAQSQPLKKLSLQRQQAKSFVHNDHLIASLKGIQAAVKPYKSLEFNFPTTTQTTSPDSATVTTWLKAIWVESAHVCVCACMEKNTRHARFGS